MNLQKRDDIKETIALYFEALGRAKQSMYIGFFICFVGILISLVTYGAASDGGYYFVMYGAILFGGIQGIKGGWNYWKLKKIISY